jgi:hypothetical protein
LRSDPPPCTSRFSPRISVAITCGHSRRALWAVRAYPTASGLRPAAMAQQRALQRFTSCASHRWDAAAPSCGAVRPNSGTAVNERYCEPSGHVGAPSTRCASQAGRCPRGRARTARPPWTSSRARSPTRSASRRRTCCSERLRPPKQRTAKAAMRMRVLFQRLLSIGCGRHGADRCTVTAQCLH